jgi:hypothetical protein
MGTWGVTPSARSREPRELDPVQNGHHPVEHHDVRVKPLQPFERFGTVLGLLDVAHAQPAQHGAQDAPHVQAILDDEDAER